MQMEVKTEVYTCKSDVNYSETYGIPDLEKTYGINFTNRDKFNKLDPLDGVVKVGSKVKKGDYVVGKFSPIYENYVDAMTENRMNLLSNGKQFLFYNRFESYNKEDPAQVVQVYFYMNSVYITYAFMKDLKLVIDFSNRHGQKGVIGGIVPEIDLPFCPLTGMTPDIIINSLAFPSRMTIGQILEEVLGQFGAHLGEIWNATTFEGSNVEYSKQILTENGYSQLEKNYYIMVKMVN